MRDFDVAVGAALCSLRDRAGLTVLDMVERTGIAGSDLMSYEAGRTISPSDLRAISVALGMSLPSFLGYAYPRLSDPVTSEATPEEGLELVERFVQVRDPRSRRFLIDMAHALGDHEVNADR